MSFKTKDVSSLKPVSVYNLCLFVQGSARHGGEWKFSSNEVTSSASSTKRLRSIISYPRDKRSYRDF
jgi:hypothetical protein